MLPSQPPRADHQSSPSANAIRVADYCTADHVDNVESFVDPYPFNQYDLGNATKAVFTAGTGHPLDANRGSGVCKSGCDPLGVLAGGHPFQFAGIDGRESDVSQLTDHFSGNDPKSGGTVYPTQTTLRIETSPLTYKGGHWMANQIVTRENEEQTWMKLRPRYSFATRTFTQIINW